MNEWISVKDQNPPKDRDFLGYILAGFWCEGIKDDRTRDIENCRWNGSKYMESCHCSGYEHDPAYIEVTHWMELPLVPQEEINE